MKKTKLITLFLILVIAFSVLTGCQSAAAKTVDEQILLLSDDITLESGKNLIDLKNQIDMLTEKEQKSLRNIAAFNAYYDEYKALEDQAVEEIEALIEALPSPKKIKLATEDVIEEAEKAYNRTTDIVRERISNADTLESMRDKMDEYKKSCWVECSRCGGNGRVTCSLCHGSGSRKVYHTTPNGKRWLVSQDCSTTRNCGTCGGRGGIYVES